MVVVGRLGGRRHALHRAGDGAAQRGPRQHVRGRSLADLMLRTAEGRHFKTVMIVVPGKDGKGLTLTFTDVLISSYQVSGDLETWSHAFAKKGFSRSPPQAQPRP